MSFLRKLLGLSDPVAISCPACDARADEIAFLRQNLKHLQNEVLEMRREGFSGLPRYSPNNEASDQVPSSVREALDSVAANNASLRREMEEWAKQRLNEGQEEEALVDSIYSGGEVPWL